MKTQSNELINLGGGALSPVVSSDSLSLIPSTPASTTQDKPIVEAYMFSKSRMMYYKRIDFWHQSIDWIMTRYIAVERLALSKGLNVGNMFISGNKFYKDMTMMECYTDSGKSRIRLQELTNDNKKYMVGVRGKINRIGNRVIRFYVDPFFCKYHAQLIERQGKGRNNRSWNRPVVKTKFENVIIPEVIVEADKEVKCYIGAAAYLIKILCDWAGMHHRFEYLSRCRKLRIAVNDTNSRAMFHLMLGSLMYILNGNQNTLEEYLSAKLNEAEDVSKVS